MAVDRRTRAWRAGFGGTLALGMAAATVSQFLFGVLGPYLVKEFGISRAHLGLLTMTAFLVGGIGSPAAGSVTDRIGGRKVFLGSLVAMAVALLGIAPRLFSPPWSPRLRSPASGWRRAIPQPTSCSRSSSSSESAA